MSTERRQMLLRFSGGETAPATVPVRELANLILAVEETVVAVAQSTKDVGRKEELALTLTGLTDSSLGLQFATPAPETLMPSFVRVARAIASETLDLLPVSALSGLRYLQGFIKRHKCVVEFRVGSMESPPIAVMTPETELQGTPKLRGTTVLYGRVTRVGGATPKVQIEQANGERLSCEVTVSIAKELGRRLYDRVGLSGEALWNAETWAVESFRVEEIEGYQERSPLAVVRDLRDHFGQHFDEIDDADAFVRSLREDDGED